jgi:hypothetical protein
MISKGQARDLMCEIAENDTTLMFELPLAGQRVESIGRVTVTWQFPDEESTSSSSDFFVFEELITPIIIGHAFLRATNTFDKYKHRLKTIPSTKSPLMPLVRWSGLGQETLQCYLDERFTSSIPDTGSEINVISLQFANKLTPFIDRTVAGKVQFANGQIQDTMGRIRAKVTFGDMPDFYIEAKFEVLEGLRVDVILGDDILYDADIYSKYANLFVSCQEGAECSALGTIGWLGIGEKFIHKTGKKIAAATSGKKEHPTTTKTDLKVLDDQDLEEEERQQREEARMEKLRGKELAEAKTREAQKHAEYLARRVGYSFGNSAPRAP